MLKLYSLIVAASIFSSCGVSVSYLGNAYDKTSRVDVYVDPSAIKKPYTVMGKGYEERLVGYRYSVEKIQERAIAKAKEKGADAILFQDYYLQHAGTAYSTSTTVKVDTINRTVVTSGNGQSGPVVSTGRHILFLKYY